MPDYVIQAAQDQIRNRRQDAVSDAQIKSWLYDLTQRQRQDEAARAGHAALLKALNPDVQALQAPAPAPSDTGGANVVTTPFSAPPPPVGVNLPTPPPGQPSVPMQRPGAPPMGAMPPGGAPNPAALLGPKGQAYLAAQPANARPAALQVLLANLMGKGATATAPPPGAGAPPPQPPAPAVAPAGAPGPAPDGAAPPAPQGWKPMPQPPAMGAGPPGMPTSGSPSGMDPAKMPSIPMLIDRMNKAKVDPEAQYQALQAYSKIEDSETKKALQNAREQAQVYRAMAEAGRLELQNIREGRLAASDKRRQDRLDANERRLEAAPPKKSGSPISPDDAGGLSEAGLDLAATMYRKKGIMPALGFSTTAAKLAIINRAALQAAAEGQTAGEVPGGQAEFKANSNALTQITKDLTAIVPYDEMLNKNGAILKDLSSKVVRSNSAWANKPVLWLQQNAGDNPDVAQYLAQVQIFQTEAAKVLNNPRLVGQLTDSARHEMQDIIRGSMPIGQLNAVIDRLISDGKNRVDAMQDQSSKLRRDLGIGKVGGSAPDKTAATREFASESEAKNAGLKPGTRVKIGGVMGTWQ